MSLDKYINSNKKGEDANRIEKESLKDPFLSDALDGIAQVAGDHNAAMNAMKIRLAEVNREKFQRKKNYLAIVAVLTLVAASLTLLFAMPYFRENNSAYDTDVLYTDMEEVEPIDIYVPNAVSLIAGSNDLVYCNASDLSVIILNDSWIADGDIRECTMTIINVYLPE